MPDQAKVVIIGAGVVGCSIAYHLTRLGWNDVVVLEQGPLFDTGGSSSRAPAIIFQTNPSRLYSRPVTWVRSRGHGSARLVARRPHHLLRGCKVAADNGAFSQLGGAKDSVGHRVASDIAAARRPVLNSGAGAPEGEHTESPPPPRDLPRGAGGASLQISCGLLPDHVSWS